MGRGKVLNQGGIFGCVFEGVEVCPAFEIFEGEIEKEGKRFLNEKAFGRVV